MTVPTPTLSPGTLTPDPDPAPARRRVLAQAAFDLRAYLRNGEQLVLTMLLPALILVGLSRTGVPGLPSDHPDRLATVVAGTFALAVISTAFTGQAIGTGFDRRYGVLRLLAATPLGADGLLAGRVVAVLGVEAVQLVLLGGVGIVLGWRPGSLVVLPLATAVVVGTAAFVALGLLLAGTLRAEAVLAVANLAWVVILAVGGALVPAERWGGWGAVAPFLPPGALGDLMRAAVVQGQVSWTAALILVAWSAAASLGVRTWFRWV